jgi:hypothetical protein
MTEDNPEWDDATRDRVLRVKRVEPYSEWNAAIDAAAHAADDWDHGGDPGTMYAATHIRDRILCLKRVAGPEQGQAPDDPVGEIAEARERAERDYYARYWR